MDSVEKPRAEAGRRRPLVGWAALSALALSALAVLGALWLAGPFRAAAPPSAPEARRLKLDLNAASAEELRLLPGIGPERSERLIRARQKRGGFQSLRELDEPGLLGPGASERLRAYLQPLPGDG